MERLIGRASFSLGLILVVVVGVELFTGNNLVVITWADRKIGMGRLLRNWGLGYIANLAGALMIALMALFSTVLVGAGGAVGEIATRVATAKIALALSEAFFCGVPCNALVCLALWLTMAAHAVSGKILAILFPITAFFVIGCKHSVANIFFILLGMLTSVDPAAAGLTMVGSVANLIPVILGNIVGGSVVVPLVRYIIYVHDVRSQDAG